MATTRKAEPEAKPDVRIEIKFTRLRETKNKVVYEEQSDVPVIGTLYVTKGYVEMLANPEGLVVTLDGLE